MTALKAWTRTSMSSSEATRGGASRTVWPWASLASTPWARRASVTSRPVATPSVTSMPHHRPRIRTASKPLPTSGARAVAAQRGGAELEPGAEAHRGVLELAGLQHRHDLAADGRGEGVAAEG